MRRPSEPVQPDAWPRISMVDFGGGRRAYSAPDVEMSTTPVQLPPSQRTNYQFPVYRWIGWLAVAGFAIGLTVMFFISGMFGIPAPLGWAFIVTVFAFGSLLLDRPKLLLNCMLFYFLLMPGNRLLGIVWLPLPGFVDELFFLPLIAVIVMHWIQRHQLREATLFPLAFCLIAALSWYVNRPPVFRVLQVTLVMLKSYILWYFCRLTCTFKDESHLSKWVWGYVIFAAVQFLYNMLWQQGPWPKFHPDRSGGVFGPDAIGAAHLVGYISSFALLLLAGWWVSQGAIASRSRRWGAAALALIIIYDLAFMTDTKHALFILPIFFAPLLFHSRVSTRLRMGMLFGVVIFLLSAFTYLSISMEGMQMSRYMRSIKNTPKSDLLYAVTVDLKYLVPYPLLGAGPGMFSSGQARDAQTPLARRYILPYYNEARRLKYFGMQGSTAVSSVGGSVNTDFFVLMGEFGWLGAAAFYGFYIWVLRRLIRKSKDVSAGSMESGIYAALACCVGFLIIITGLTSASTVPVLAFPLWMLIGRAWDMKPGCEQEPVPGTA